MSKIIIICIIFYLIIIILLMSIVKVELMSRNLKYTRQNLKPIRGVSPDTGRYVFFFEYSSWFSKSMCAGIEKFYGKNSIIIDNTGVYKILMVREGTRKELEKEYMKKKVLEVDQYASNCIEKIYMHEYEKYIYILENREVFVELSEYERDIYFIKENLESSEPVVGRKLEDLFLGFPISVEAALKIGLAVSSYFNDENSQESGFANFINSVYLLLVSFDKTANRDVGYSLESENNLTDQVIEQMVSVLDEMSERCGHLVGRDEVVLTADFQSAITPVLNAKYGIQISREYTMGRSIKKLGETDLFFFRYQEGIKQEIYILENKVIKDFKSKQYDQLMGYLNPNFMAGITLSINKNKNWEEAFDYIFEKLEEIKSTGEDFSPITIKRKRVGNVTKYVKTEHIVPETGLPMPVYHLVLQLYDGARQKAALRGRN